MLCIICFIVEFECFVITFVQHLVSVYLASLDVWCRFWRLTSCIPCHTL